MKRRAASLALLVVLAAGCSVGSSLDQIDAEYQQALDIVCDCTNVFPDQAACEGQFQSIFSAFDRDCLEDALEVDKKASRKSLECIVDRLKDYNGCLEDMLDCNDHNSVQGCEPLLSFDDCPSLPADVQTRVDACGGDDA